MMMMWGFVLLLLLGGAVIAILLGIGGVGWLSRRDSRGPWQGASHPPTARQILDERLARGEIDAEEYGTLRAQIEE